MLPARSRISILRWVLPMLLTHPKKHTQVSKFDKDHAVVTIMTNTTTLSTVPNILLVGPRATGTAMSFRYCVLRSWRSFDIPRQIEGLEISVDGTYMRKVRLFGLGQPIIHILQ
ncbi:hypothetical protein BJ742DRAFT_125039 [Cladochytrium replicatum]|nr:hypothetical protein BJ742DRAFT_125039 [Cladochytrium replicatum]